MWQLNISFRDMHLKLQFVGFALHYRDGSSMSSSSQDDKDACKCSGRQVESTRSRGGGHPRSPWQFYISVDLSQKCMHFKNQNTNVFHLEHFCNFFVVFQVSTFNEFFCNHRCAVELEMCLLSISIVKKMVPRGVYGPTTTSHKYPKIRTLLMFSIPPRHALATSSCLSPRG
jgi:hypothetical protein